MENRAISSGINNAEIQADIFQDFVSELGITHIDKSASIPAGLPLSKEQFILKYEHLGNEAVHIWDRGEMYSRRRFANLKPSDSPDIAWWNKYLAGEVELANAVGNGRAENSELIVEAYKNYSRLHRSPEQVSTWEKADLLDHSIVLIQADKKCYVIVLYRPDVVQDIISTEISDYSERLKLHLNQTEKTTVEETVISSNENSSHSQLEFKTNKLLPDEDEAVAIRMKLQEWNGNHPVPAPTLVRVHSRHVGLGEKYAGKVGKFIDRLIKPRHKDTSISYGENYLAAYEIQTH